MGERRCLSLLFAVLPARARARRRPACSRHTHHVEKSVVAHHVQELTTRVATRSVSNALVRSNRPKNLFDVNLVLMAVDEREAALLRKERGHPRQTRVGAERFLHLRITFSFRSEVAAHLEQSA